MEYKQIGQFLNKFKKILFDLDFSYKIISETISRHISVDIKKDQLKIKNSTIYIKGSPILKNEILIHKQVILSDLKSLIPDKNFTDIR